MEINATAYPDKRSRRGAVFTMLDGPDGSLLHLGHYPGMSKAGEGVPTGSVLSDVLGQRYVAQRERGFRSLRFEPQLETEYLDQMRNDQRISALICTATALAIWIFFAAFDLIRLNLHTEYPAGRADVTVAAGLRLVTMCILVGALVCQLSAKTRLYPWVALLSLIMIGAAAAVNANVYKVRGMPHAELAQFAIIIAVYLPLGLTFRQAICAAGVVAAAVAAAGFLMLDVSRWRTRCG